MAHHSPVACEANKKGTLISIVMTSICTSSSSKLRNVLCCSKCPFIWYGIVLSGSKKWTCIFSLGKLLYIISAQNISGTQLLIRNKNQLLSCWPSWGVCWPKMWLPSSGPQGRAEGALGMFQKEAQLGGSSAWGSSCFVLLEFKDTFKPFLPLERVWNIISQAVPCRTPEETCSKEWLNKRGTNIGHFFFSLFLVSQGKANL